MLAATLLQAEAAEREALLAALAVQLSGFRVPGGDVRVWLSEVTTLTLRGLVSNDPTETAERLMRFTGLVRRAHERDPLVDPAEADLTNLARAPRAHAALLAWAQRILARDGEAVA